MWYVKSGGGLTIAPKSFNVHFIVIIIIILQFRLGHQPMILETHQVRCDPNSETSFP